MKRLLIGPRYQVSWVDEGPTKRLLRQRREKEKREKEKKEKKT